jgi:hypothetical protein
MAIRKTLSAAVEDDHLKGGDVYTAGWPSNGL